MSTADIKKNAQDKMAKSLETLRADLAKVRTGRAHTGILDHVMVDYYGNPTPINGYNANSICAFSGLDDMDFEAPVQPGVVQNWGSIPKEIRDFLATIGEHPGTACNGSKNGTKG